MAKKRQQLATLSDQLRSIIDNGRQTRYRVSKMAKVDGAQLHRFMNRTGRLTTDSLDRIGLALKLRLIQEDD